MSRLSSAAAGRLLLALLAAAGPIGCQSNWMSGFWPRDPSPPLPGSVEVPEPLNLLLPSEIKIHSFTGTRTFDEKAGGVRGIDVRVEAIDAYGDSTKAFGDFRFEIWTYIPNSLNKKGTQLSTGSESVRQPRKNLVHWDKCARAYRFKLKWDQSIPVGQRFVLVAVFESPFTQRLYNDHVFISGE